MKTVKLGITLCVLWFLSGGCKDKLIVNKCKLSYDQGDVLYLSSANTPAIPSVDPNARGVFAADPDGLSIDQNTGYIDINNSATGQKYLVKYISLDNNQICETFITISGVRYTAGVYNRSTANSLVVNPIYNANSDSRLPSGNFQGGRNQQGVIVLPEVTAADGSIDLKGVNLNRLFSQSGTIRDGSEVQVTIPFSLNDDSGGIQNQVTLNFIYYNAQSSIPEALLAEIKEQQEETRGGRINGEKNHRPPGVIVTEK
ncbi:hypothetical protein QNI16_23380 [Cytophagaceae bacterium YF14B1]|uniref:Lipoprotein n=1 Tax=Xanthocytophaga flava TaxID=3048013 RepID=A0AAE3QUE3_9BACT|nr:hypothetical protein [Xanthocytophaga flavus]MDJ1483461.1 hypothetical protein [Xanthocytophaga flavus]